MKIEKLFNKIKEVKPQIIYLSGKTATGKTTFSNQLHNDLGYSQIELDQIVMNSVVNKYKPKEDGDAFVVAYRDGEPQEWRDVFVAETKKVLSKEAQTKHLVIEGAIANIKTLEDIFDKYQDSFMFVYFQPVDRQKYINRIKKRLTIGINKQNCSLPKSFWSLGLENEKEEYISTGRISLSLENVIDKYVDSSMEESNDRLNLFKNSFKDIIVIDA